MIPDYHLVIPARYGSSRFPGKPLALLLGRPMIEHVYDRAQQCAATDVVVATDDERISSHCDACGIPVVMTAVEHVNGTERLAEVAQLRGWSEAEIVVSLQGDEPATPPALMDQLARNLGAHADAGIATLATPINSKADYLDINRVKVVLDTRGYALYFSRAPIPWRRDDADDGTDFPPAWLHLGMYAYRCGFLHQYTGLCATPHETEEKLEQLRALEHGVRIHVAEACEMPAHGVDHPDDVAAAEIALQRF